MRVVASERSTNKEWMIVRILATDDVRMEQIVATLCKGQQIPDNPTGHKADNTTAGCCWDSTLGETAGGKYKRKNKSTSKKTPTLTASRYCGANTNPQLIPTDAIL
jgi:hypothetical protein